MKTEKDTTTTFTGPEPEPETPEVSYTSNGIFLRMNEHHLQALAIMARVYLKVVELDMWDQLGDIPASAEYANTTKTLADQIDDIT